jgi:hypothetical protein
MRLVRCARQTETNKKICIFAAAIFLFILQSYPLGYTMIPQG